MILSPTRLKCPSKTGKSTKHLLENIHFGWGSSWLSHQLSYCQLLLVEYIPLFILDMYKISHPVPYIYIPYNPGYMIYLIWYIRIYCILNTFIYIPFFHIPPKYINHKWAIKNALIPSHYTSWLKTVSLWLIIIPSKLGSITYWC